MFLHIEKDKAKVLDYICNCELMFAPGEEKYSDLGFQMLGFLVERIAGARWTNTSRTRSTSLWG